MVCLVELGLQGLENLVPLLRVVVRGQVALQNGAVLPCVRPPTRREESETARSGAAFSQRLSTSRICQRAFLPLPLRMPSDDVVY